MNSSKCLLYLSLIFTCSLAETNQISFTLDLFSEEPCQTKVGTVEPNPSQIQEDVCTKLDFMLGGWPASRNIKVNCLEPGKVNVALYESCTDSSPLVVTALPYGTCTQLPAEFYGLAGRAIWEGGCIDSGVSTSTSPTQSPTSPPSSSAPSVGPSKSPSTFPTPSSPTRGPTIAPSASSPSAPPSVMPSHFPTFSDPTFMPSADPSVSPSRFPTMSPTNPTRSPSAAPTTHAEFIYVKMEIGRLSCATADKGKVAAAVVAGCELNPSKVDVPYCVQNETSKISVHWVEIESRQGSLHKYIVSENFTIFVNQMLHPASLKAVSLESYIPSTTQEAIIISTTDASQFEIGVGVMLLAITFLLAIWIMIHCVLYWKFSFYKSATLFRWESLTWTLFLAHTFDFCSDVFLCYETSTIFGTSDWTFLVSCSSLILTLSVNFYHLIKFLNFAFKNPDTKHWLLKDSGLQMIVFIFLLCGGNPSFLSVLVSMVIINRVPLTTMEIMHFSSHRWTVVFMENIPQLIVGLWTLQEAKKVARLFVILSIAFSAISSISILIISWYQQHHKIVPVRMEIEIYNIPRLRRIHFIPVQKLLERTHEGISIEVYHLQQTDGGLTIRFAVCEIHQAKYEKSKRHTIARFTDLFRDRTDWVHKKEDVENFTKAKGTARRIQGFSEIVMANLSSAEGEVGFHQRVYTEFSIRCSNSPSGEGESIAYDTYPMNIVSSRSASDSEPNIWGDNPQEGGGTMEGFQATSSEGSEPNHSLQDQRGT